jgi:hypothetical protein
VTATMLTASLVVGIVRRRRSAHNLSV